MITPSQIADKGVFPHPKAPLGSWAGLTFRELAAIEIMATLTHFGWSKEVAAQQAVERADALAAALTQTNPPTSQTS